MQIFPCIILKNFTLSLESLHNLLKTYLSLMSNLHFTRKLLKYKRKLHCWLLRILLWVFVITWCPSLYVVNFFYNLWYHIAGVMVCMLTSCTVNHGFNPGAVKPKTMKLVFVAFPLSTQHYGGRAKTNWLRIRIMCHSEQHINPQTVVSVSCMY
jgi:hypothetical protein